MRYSALPSSEGLRSGPVDPEMIEEASPVRIELTRHGPVALVHGRSFCPERRSARSPLLIIRIGLTAPPSTTSARRRLFQSGDNRTRTDDPLRAKQVLSQLSYAPLMFTYTPERGTLDPLPIHFFHFHRKGRTGGP